MHSTLFERARKLALPLLLPAAALVLLGAASHANAKRLGSAMAMQVNAAGNQAMADWNLCSNGAPIFSVAGGYDTNNNLVCAISTRGQSTFMDCPESAARHRSWWRAGTFTSTASPFSSQWVQSNKWSLGSVTACSAQHPCATRTIDVADMGN